MGGEGLPEEIATLLLADHCYTNFSVMPPYFGLSTYFLSHKGEENIYNIYGVNNENNLSI